MDLNSVITFLPICISSDTPLINAFELYSFLEIEIPFNEWIDDLINGSKNYHSYIVIKKNKTEIKSETNLIYYINLKLAKIAALKVGSKPGAIAYNYLRNCQKEEEG